MYGKCRDFFTIESSNHAYMKFYFLKLSEKVWICTLVVFWKFMRGVGEILSVFNISDVPLLNTMDDVASP